MNNTEVEQVGRDVIDLSNNIEVSPFIAELLNQPEVYQELKELLELEDVGEFKGRFESSYKHSLDTAKIAEVVYDNYLVGNSAERFEKIDKETLVKAALLHDIGKDRIPLDILVKEGKLTPSEITKVRAHSVNGAKKIQAIANQPDFEGDREKMWIISEVVKRHHFYSEGYPDMGELWEHPDEEKRALIEEVSKVLSVIDIFDALRSQRSYSKEPASASVVREILLNKIPGEEELVEFLISNFIKEK